MWVAEAKNKDTEKMLKLIITKYKKGLVLVSQDQKYWVGFKGVGLRISLQKREGNI